MHDERVDTVMTVVCRPHAVRYEHERIVTPSPLLLGMCVGSD